MTTPNPVRPTARATDCTGTVGHDGRCLQCREVVFPHLWDAHLRRTRKPAKRAGLLPVGIRRAAR